MNNRVHPSPYYGQAPPPPYSKWAPAASTGLSVTAKIVIGIAVAAIIIVVIIVVAVVLAVILPQSDEQKPFKCDDGTDINRSHVCDGYMECEGGEDEEDCSCGNHETSCSSDGVCIYDAWFCDGTTDCSAGEDEDDCGLSCTSSQFACADHSQCIAVSFRCDGTYHCSDGSDEWDCLKLANNDVLLVLLGEDTYRPVCSSAWGSANNNNACDEMGYGTSSSSGTYSAVSVAQSANGYAAVAGSYSSSMLDVLVTASSCASEAVVTLNCNYDSCGTRGQSLPHTTGQERIIQGYRADEGAWPWQVAIMESGQQICGGSLISSTWVLTAAHCITYHYSYYSIRVGSVKNSGSDTHLQTSNVINAVVHENYDDYNIINDVALLELETPMDITGDYVRPICLPESGETFFDSVVCYTSGWGSWELTASEYPDLLQEVKMPLISDSACDNDPTMAAVGGVHDNTGLCAGYPDGYITICSGDSGGPLVCRDKRNVWTLAGVTSWGVGTSAEPCDSISVYAEVSYFRDWIDTYIAS